MSCCTSRSPVPPDIIVKPVVVQVLKVQILKVVVLQVGIAESPETPPPPPVIVLFKIQIKNYNFCSHIKCWISSYNTWASSTTCQCCNSWKCIATRTIIIHSDNISCSACKSGSSRCINTSITSVLKYILLLLMFLL